MCVCMCVAGLSLDKEGTEKRERKKGDFDESAVGCWPTAGRESEPREEQREGPHEIAASLPLVPGQIYSACHVIVPVGLAVCA